MSWIRHELELPPRVKPRPRVTGHNTYMPKPYQEWRKDVQSLLHGQGAVLHDTPMALEVAFYRKRMEIWYRTLDIPVDGRKGLPTGDVDNLLGGVMDAAEGVLWVNDRQIHQIRGEIR